MKPASRIVAYGFLALSMALVGSYVALSKPLVAVLPVFLLSWLRFGIGLVAMLPWLAKPADEPPMSRRTHGLVFIESLFGNFLFSLCMLWGVSMTSAVSAGVILSAIPAVVAVMSRLFLGEQVGPKVWLGSVCGVLGIGLFSLSIPEQTLQTDLTRMAYFSHQNAGLGNALVAGAVLCEGAYAVIGKKLTGVMRPKRIAALINVWGFVLMTPMGLYVAWSFDFGAISPGVWLLLVFYALAASVWTVWLWMTGLRTVPAAQSGVFTVMLPLSAALVGVLALGETLSRSQIAAFAVALAGVLLATWPSKVVVTD